MAQRRSIRLSALIVVVCAVSATPADATFPGHPGLLAFDSYDPSGLRRVGVYTVSPDGAVTAPIQAPGREPRWSPNGRRILYTRDARGASGFWSAAPDGAEVRQDIPAATGEQVDGAAWGPDGQAVVIRVSRDVGPARAATRRAVRSTIYTTRIGGDRRHRLWRGDDLSDPTWSPDGRLIAFVTRDRIAVIRPDGSRFRVLATLRYVRSLGFAPDGRRLVYTEGAGRAAAINVMDIATGATTTVVRATAAERPGAVTWSPDGTELAFVWVQDGSAGGAGPAWRESIHVVRPDGTARRHRFELPPYSYVLSGLSWQAIPRVGLLSPVAPPWPAVATTDEGIS